MSPNRTAEPLATSLPRLLKQRGLSIRAIARMAGVDAGHLSKVLRGVNYKSASGEIACRIAEALDLPGDYFPEYRQAVVINEVRSNGRWRDAAYDQLRKSYPSDG